MKLESVVKKNRKLIAVAFVVLLCYWAGTATGMFKLQITGNAGLGPEGVDCGLYGVQANNGLQLKEHDLPLDISRGTMSAVGSVNPGDWIGKGYFLSSSNPRYVSGYQWTRPDRKTPQIKALCVDANTGQMDSSVGGLSVAIGVQRPQVSELNQHGYPEGTTSPERIDWYSYNTQMVNGTTQVTWHHYEAYVVPVDFYVSFTVLPLNGGSWGAFEGVDLWFQMNTNVWLDAFTRGQMLDAQDKVANTTITAADYRGAFPIWAWVGQWNPYVIVDEEGNILSSSGVPAEMSAFTNVEPSFAGREVSLYSQPSWVSQTISPISGVANPASVGAALGQKVGNAGDRSQTACYVPITLAKFGGLYQGGGTGPWAWSNYYYPSASMRIRVLYAVWGEWVYLWTKQEAEEQGYDWENRNGTTIINPSAWDSWASGLSSWFANNQLWVLVVVAVIVLLVVSITQPGLLALLMSRRRRE